MTQTIEQRRAKVFERARSRFMAAETSARDERMQCLRDRRNTWIAGAMWEGSLGEQFENLPKFEVNKLAMAVTRIFSEYRNNRISVDFRPKTGDDSVTADSLDGLYRADEQDSGAQEAYDNAFEEGVTGGMGAWRLRADVEDPYGDDDRQRICLEPIYDADTCVYFDPASKRYDKSDAGWCVVLASVPLETFKDDYPDQDPASWPKTVQQWMYDWLRNNCVFVAEYYEVEEKSETIHVFQGLDGDQQEVADDDLEEMQDQLHATGYEEVRTRKRKTRKVHKYLMSGGGILEDYGYIAGKHIPIVPFYGKRFFIDNIERCVGHVRYATDSMRLKNMQVSRLAQTAALSPIEKPIFTAEQIASHQQVWADDPVKQYPYLTINSVTDGQGNKQLLGPVGYTKPPQIPPAMVGLLQLTDGDLDQLLGNQEAAEEVVSNVSAKAMELAGSRKDMQGFIYLDNMAKSMKRCGEIWFSMAQDVYVEEGREMKTVGDRGDAGQVKLSQPMIDDKTGAQYTAMDLSNAKMEVVVDVGPNFSSKRDSTVRSLLGILPATQNDPDTQNVLVSTIIMNLDGEGLTDLQDYFRKKLVAIGAVKPTDDEAKQMAEAQANQQPDPQAQYLQSAADEAQANAANARAKTLQTVADAHLKDAQRIKTLVEAHQPQQLQ